MMNTLLPYLHSYALCLLRPRTMLDWLRYGTSPYPDGDHDLVQPELTGQLSVSWMFAVVQGIVRIMMANIMVQLFLHYQNEDNFFYSLVDVQDGLFPYYVLLFTTALDLVFFPIITLVVTEFWNFILRQYARWLQVEGDHDDIARDITTVALSSHFFLVLPIIGVVFQQIAWIYLLYVGCRHHLQATRLLSIVILITPTVLMLMSISVFSLAIFYLIAG
jgi:hypothetical protein